MAKANFDKFINKPVKGAKVKEAFRQEKKAAVKERREAIEKYYEEKRKLKAERFSKEGINENRSFKGENKKSYTKNNTTKPPYQKSFEKKIDGESATKAFNAQSPKSYKKPFDKKGNTSGEKSPSFNDYSAKHPYKKPYQNKLTTSHDKRPTQKFIPQKTTPVKQINYNDLTPDELAMSDGADHQPEIRKDLNSDKKERINPADKYKKKDKKLSKFSGEKNEDRGVVISNEMPLNKFIAHAGVCSRRDAVDLVRTGNVTVNGEKINEPAFKVSDDAVVKIDGKQINRSKNQVYILLNKPKDYITTADDPQGRKTVMDIIKNATNERVYPVGRLDRNTSGVLLLTNDGDLAQQLSHPSFEVRKIYEVKLNKVLQKDDFEKILNGVKLEDGEVHADSLAYADKDKSIVGIEIHSGKNRVVRRIFEKLGYDVRGLDRVMYANLTKKNVERGKWRFLNEKEIRLLKYFNKSKVGK